MADEAVLRIIMQGGSGGGSSTSQATSQSYQPPPYQTSYQPPAPSRNYGGLSTSSTQDTFDSDLLVNDARKIEIAKLQREELGRIWRDYYGDARAATEDELDLIKDGLEETRGVTIEELNAIKETFGATRGATLAELQLIKKDYEEGTRGVTKAELDIIKGGYAEGTRGADQDELDFVKNVIYPEVHPVEEESLLSKILGIGREVGGKTGRASGLLQGLLPELESFGGIGAGGAGGAEGMAALIGAAAGPVGALTVAVVASTAAFGALVQNIDRTAQRYGEYSPEISQAQAIADVRMSLGEIRRAERLGPELARFVSTTSKIENKFEDMKTSLLIPIVSTLNGILVILEKIMPSGQGFDVVLESASSGLLQGLLGALGPLVPIAQAASVLADRDRQGGDPTETILNRAGRTPFGQELNMLGGVPGA